MMLLVWQSRELLKTLLRYTEVGQSHADKVEEVKHMRMEEEEGVRKGAEML